MGRMLPPASTFNEAPDDVVSKLFVPELIDYNATHSPDHALFVYESSIGSGHVEAITWKLFHKAANNAADHVAARLMEDKLVVGVLASLDSMTYSALVWGLWLAGAAPFLISTRNSPAAVAHLISETKVTALFVSPDEQMQSLATAALRAISETESTFNIEMVPTPTFSELFGREDSQVGERKMPSKIMEEDPALILHSSGSTAFPKPIILTHRILRHWMMGWRQPDASRSLRRIRLAAHALPMFHGLGVGGLICTTAGNSIAVFPPSDKPVVPSPDLFLNSAIATQCDALFTVPSFLELWSRDPQAVEKLKTFKVVPFGGGPLGRDFGNSLWEQGVKILNIYGSTEIGLGSVPWSDPYPDWEYITLLSRNGNYLRPLDDETGHYEMIFLETDKHSPAVLNFEMAGAQGFATNDLVERHPTNPMKVKILGRVDDQIMLSTGEKTNPGPMEAIISRDPHVSAAIMFGRGREQNGIIVQPRIAVRPDDDAAMENFRNDIWSSVEKANAYAPSHSRIFKEMIIVSNPSKPFHFTPKGSIKRKATLDNYKIEIEALYTAVEQSSQSDIVGPSQWTVEDVRDFVRRLITKIMEEELGDDVDIFVRGGDSLRATWIRNSILHAIRQSPHAGKARAIGQDFVYSNPTITKLTASILTVIGAIDEGFTTSDNAQKGIDEIESLISIYTQNFPSHHPDPSRVKNFGGEVVLITGTTGGLGAQLVATLAAKEDIARIYAFNRAGDEPIASRQRMAFTERGLDVRLLDGGKVVLVEGAAEEDDLGISKDLFNEMRDSITLTIHNAWRVNFVLGLSAFTPLIKATRNIVDFSLSSPRAEPPRIVFTSSVGVFSNWQSNDYAPEGPVDARTALGNGYSRSKHVTERILEAANTRSPLWPVIVRVGQLTSTLSGAWNKTDWVPAIVRSGKVIGALPDRDDDIAWLSLDVAANAIYDFRNASSAHVNLQHPCPYSWSSVFRAFSKHLDVPLISWTEWLQKLEQTTEADPHNVAKLNPASMLLDTFRLAPTSAAAGKEAPGNIPFLSLEKALMSSDTLRRVRNDPVDVDGEVQKWVAYWSKVGLLK